MNDEFCVACGEDVTGETDRMVKEKKSACMGTLRSQTRRLVLESWDKLEG